MRLCVEPLWNSGNALENEARGGRCKKKCARIGLERYS